MFSIQASLNPVLQRALVSLVCFTALAVQPLQAEPRLVPGDTQYIAALADPNATSGTGAQSWGIWTVDPGPRGIKASEFETLLSETGLAPEGWQFDPAAWWLEEHGLIMEAPTFPLPPGQYVVTGARQVTTVLTIDPADATGQQAWRLADGASLYDVTHLRCRAALYTARTGSQSCSPEKTPISDFPMSPGLAMPTIDGCNKQDYQVLIVLGMMIDG